MTRRLTAGVLVVFAGAAGGSAIAKNASTAAQRKPGPFYGLLLGKNEISPAGKKGAGDKDGRGGATAVLDEGKLCFGLTVKNLDTPVAAHIHSGGPSTNGGVKVALKHPTDGDPGASSGCVAVSATQAAALRANPGRYYWNVHTEKYPNGAIRGQLSVKSR